MSPVVKQSIEAFGALFCRYEMASEQPEMSAFGEITFSIGEEEIKESQRVLRDEEMANEQPEMGVFGDNTYYYIREEDVEESKRVLRDKGPSGLQGFLKRKLDQWKDVPLNIGVTGQSGCGKSTFINTMRGLTAEDEGAAAVGVVETTTECRPYPHPGNKSFVLWDLPGAGTPKFPRSTYLDQVKFDKYDFFLIMSRSRFTEDDLWLGKEVKARGKLFFFIRTRIDEDMRNDKEDHPRTHDETKVLDAVRQNCLTNLQACNVSEIFLISGKKINMMRWDFPELNKHLIERIPGLKRHAMVLSLTANSKDVIEEKYNTLWKRIWIVAGLSAAVAVMPIPGLSVAADVGLLIAEVNVYKTQLKLDQKSLEDFSST